MIPAYIIDKDRKEQDSNRIQLEIPDYTLEYEEWQRKKYQEQQDNKQETVIIIDIY